MSRFVDGQSGRPRIARKDGTISAGAAGRCRGRFVEVTRSRCARVLGPKPLARLDDVDAFASFAELAEAAGSAKCSAPSCARRRRCN